MERSVTDPLRLSGPRPLRGRLRVPGDKGISHRALLAGALAEGVSRLEHLAPGDDVARTRATLASLGVRVEARIGGTITVEGSGPDGLQEPADVLDCANSGSTLRMLAGVLAGRPFLSVLSGDVSLRSRPMARVVEPLRALGAAIDGRDGGRLAPLVVRGGALTGTTVQLARPSGQVQTALVLAGLQADGTTEIVEPAPSRDHTERLLGALGAPLDRVDERTLAVRRGPIPPFELDVPGDPSSAAFLVVAALTVPGSEIVLEDVALNPGRIAYLDVLRAMGADLEVVPSGERLGEPTGDLVVRGSALHGTTFAPSEAIVDEVPALAVAAAFADGTTEIRDLGELRVKESDRVATVTELLTALGVRVETGSDVLAIHGGGARAAAFDSHGDHRIAMAAAVAANAVSGPSAIAGWEAVEVSYPRFAADLDRLAAS